MDKKLLKKYFITALIASLSVSALMGIVVILFGSFDETQIRILFTTLVIGFYSLTSLASLRNIESPHFSYKFFGQLSIAASLVALTLALVLIWATFDSVEAPWRATLTTLVLAVSMAHASLLLPFRQREGSVNLAATATLSFVAIVAAFLIYLVLQSNDAWLNEAFFRFLGVFAILDVLGTIVTPILSKFSPAKNRRHT